MRANRRLVAVVLAAPSDIGWSTAENGWPPDVGWGESNGEDVVRLRSLDGEDRAAVGYRPQRIKVRSGGRSLVHFARACWGDETPVCASTGSGRPIGTRFDRRGGRRPGHCSRDIVAVLWRLLRTILVHIWCAFGTYFGCARGWKHRPRVWHLRLSATYRTWNLSAVWFLLLHFLHGLRKLKDILYHPRLHLHFFLLFCNLYSVEQHGWKSIHLSERVLVCSGRGRRVYIRVIRFWGHRDELGYCGASGCLVGRMSCGMSALLQWDGDKALAVCWWYVCIVMQAVQGHI